MFFCDPKNLNIHNRFDVLFKYLYVLSKEKNIKSEYFENCYKQHLFIWNAYKEYNNPQKNTYEIFKNDFNKIIDNIKNETFDFEKSPVPIKEHNILNGSHRIAASLFFKKNVGCVESNDPSDGQVDCSWRFLKSLNRDGLIIEDHYFDRAAIEFVDLFEDSKIICLFPNAVRNGNIEKVRNIINKHGVFYEKQIALNKNGSVNLMKELYWREEWAEHGNQVGYLTKANLCFEQTFQTPLMIFITKMSAADAISCKEEIRKIYQIGKHAVHINDSHDESKRIARSLLNDNSIFFLNYGNPNKDFETKLENFKLTSANVDNLCLTTSVILQAFGLRNSKDVDYIHLNNDVNNNYDSHNQYISLYYPDNVENLLLDPRNYFYCHGVKLLSIKNLFLMKEKRSEQKDLQDIKLMENLLYV